MTSNRRGFNVHAQDAALLGLLMAAGEFGKSFAEKRLNEDQRFIFYLAMIVAGGISFGASAAFFVNNTMADFGVALVLGGLKGFFDDFWRRSGA